MKNLILGVAMAALLLSPPSAPAQTWSYYPQTYVQYVVPPTTSYYVDPSTGGTYTYTPPMVYSQPAPRVYGPGQYASYSPFYYNPSQYYGGYSYPTYTYYYPTYTYYRTWQWYR